LGHLHYLSSFAEIAVADLDASARWYEATLGFQPIAPYTFRYGRGLHMRRAEGQELLLVESTSGRATLNFAVDTGLGPLAVSAPSAQHSRALGPDEPEVLELLDPDGHQLRFFVRGV
jgi:catechol 2,3-dioxygenase-like lactoylglutathione lyase family enzyme